MPMWVVVDEKRAVAQGIVELTLVPQDPSQKFPLTEPGVHIDVTLPNGLIRQYSVTNPGDRDKLTIAVNRDVASRGGSQYIHEALACQDELDVEVVRNNFPLNASAPHSILIAGGIGITPIYSMVRELSRAERAWTLYYCTQTPAKTAYASELLALQGSKQSVVFVHDGMPGVSRLDLRSVIEQAGPQTHFYCCGPEPLLKVFLAETQARPSQCVHLEFFTGAAATQDPGVDFEVVCASAGVTVAVPSGVSILEALEQAGLSPLCSCREGICGTCETSIIEGEPDHRDHVLTEEERASGQTMMICVSRAKTTSLTLDI